MNIKQTIDFLENLQNISEKKCEKKLYNLFSEILNSLDTLDLPENTYKSITEKLKELKIDSVQEKQYKYIKRQYSLFTTYLENEYKLVEKWRYLWLGMSLWMVFGLAIATATWFEFGMWSETTGGLIGWMLIWMIIWSVMDKKAEDENRVLTKK